MRQLFFLIISSLAFAEPVISQEANGQAGKYVLDYDVPESPALYVLGLSTSNVVRGAAAKPVVASFVSQLLSGSRITPGIAIDFNPYFVYGGRLESISEYRESAEKRFLANLQVSFASVRSEADTSALRFGVGLRATLFDAHDLLADEELGSDIDTALMRAAEAPPPADIEDDEIGPAREVGGLREAYDEARERVYRKRGGALSVGWGLAGLLEGSIADRDSLKDTRNNLWMAYTYHFGAGNDLLTTARWRELEESDSGLQMGAAFRSGSERYTLSGEIFFDSVGDDDSWRLGLGANAELNVLRSLRIVTALMSEPIAQNGEATTKLRLRTSLRWNMDGEPGL